MRHYFLARLVGWHIAAGVHNEWEKGSKTLAFCTVFAVAHMLYAAAVKTITYFI